MQTVVLLVKNGIGYGHLRRAALLAEALGRTDGLRPVIVSQATTLDLLSGRGIRVVNLPLLHRVPSAVIEDAYTDFLEGLLLRLDPAVVIEDTYPDPRYLSLSALAGRPRLLVMRRLDGESFDELRTAGRFAAYDQILVAQRKDEFLREGHSAETLAAVLHSGRFTFVGNLSHHPAPGDAEAVRRRYSPAGAPLVVVNAGAGGDQLADGYGDRLFASAAAVAERLRLSGHRARFVLVTGPYYAGRPLRETPNVVVRRFEPQLAELLAAAQVAIIKPGHNVLSETLRGGAHIIAVPDASFLEGAEEHARDTVGRYGGTVTVADPEVLEALVRRALEEPPRERRLTAGQESFAEAAGIVERLADTRAGRLRPRQALLVLVPGPNWSPDTVARLLPGGAPGPVVLGAADEDGTVQVGGPDGGNGQRTSAILLGGAVPRTAPPLLAQRGVRVLISCSAKESTRVRRWLAMTPPTPALTVVRATRVTAVPGQFGPLSRRLAQALQSADPVCAVVDLSEHQQEDALANTLQELRAWLAAQPVRLVPPAAIDAFLTQRLLEPA